MTRTIASELVKRGIEVCAVVGRGRGQKEVEELDGIKVLNFTNPLTSAKLYRECNADIYHSEEVSLGSYIAMKAMPEAKHVLTFRDPRTFHDHLVEFRYAPNKLFYPLAWLYYDNYLCGRAVKKMDALFTKAKFFIPKVRKMYDIKKDISFLPDAITIPSRIKKSREPTVCFLGRLDPRKRPEIFFELAKEFPEIRFIAMGKSHNEKYEKHLRKKYGNMPNLEMPGHIIGKEKDKVLEDSWFLINTAAREGLPVSFLEACAYKCAILSNNNPDGFASNFGYYVKDNDFSAGLRFLLENDGWKQKGEKGYEYVKENYEFNKAIDMHISAYKRLLGISKQK